MEMEDGNRLACDVCQKKFSSVSTKNRHLKTMHNSKVEEKKSQHIRCPLCPEEKKEALGNHDILINHLTQVHSVSIKQFMLNFRNIKEFENWRSKENREVDYACHRRKKCLNGDQYVYYSCNRSDINEFHSNCTKRAMKRGGSIRISGICPSRILVKIFKNGMINVKFIETHVGHQDELRTKRLMKKEQNKITVKAHMKAKEMKDLVESVEFGRFKVKSSTSGEKFYIVSYNLLCDDDCRRVYCDECKICVHRYNCECPEFAMKTALCKHIHAVVLYEKRMSESVPGVLKLGNVEEDSEENLCIKEPTTSEIRYEDELCQKSKNNNEASKSVNLENNQQIVSEEIYNYIKNIDEESFKKFVGMFRTFKNNLERNKQNQ